MSLMTESLLLQAQSLRFEGEHDASIDLLRAVLSQCDADLRRAAAAEANEGGGKPLPPRSTWPQPRRPDRAPTDGNGAAVVTTLRLRRMASYQLALLLLQRGGRGDRGAGMDEREADGLLWRLGFRLRLSIKAFGYSARACGRDDAVAGGFPRSTSLFDRMAVIDDALPPPMFRALERAFRPESRYWSNFYCKMGNHAIDSVSPRQREVDEAGGTAPPRPAANQFASHNIPLSRDESPSPSSLLQHLRNAKSLLEQAAMVARHRLRGRFPELAGATSVEVWSHRRPPDGQHQLHYDMDEILLQRRMRRQTKDGGRESDDDDGRVSPRGRGEGGRTKRRRTRRDATGPSIGGRDAPGDDGISCPIASCVLTVGVPSPPRGGREGGAPPTIVCDQSIMRRDDGDGPGSLVGCLCPPRPNRLLAFEGSLLHGVVPGIPIGRRPSDGNYDECVGSGSDDSEIEFFGLASHPAGGWPRGGDDPRVTLMMGFWREVCLTTPEQPSEHLGFADAAGPNVPFDIPPGEGTWREEFGPISIIQGEIHGMTAKSIDGNGSHEDVTFIDPLWVPVHNGVEHSFGAYTLDGDAEQFRGRFFLKSLDPRDIDSEVLSGNR